MRTRAFYTSIVALFTLLDTLADSADDPHVTSPSCDGFTDDAKRDSIKKVIVLNSVIDSGDNGICLNRFPELDKRMRNYGLVKGPLSINGCRSSVQRIRTIVARTTMEANKDYYQRMKSVIDSDERQSVIILFEMFVVCFV